MPPAEEARNDAVRAALKVGVPHKKIRQITDLPLARVRGMRPPVAQKDPAPERVLNGHPSPEDKQYGVSSVARSVRAIPSGLPGLGKRRR
ncbi:hypothetical protein AR457_41765 (plasmid) [Streptomyces agglomeratus]|nr:hypothetical protein AR457_41765 [Streptomyces agglomeratus]